MTTYNIGPGETYETYTAFHAAITPSPGDIISGGENVFSEHIVITGTGTLLNPIIYQDATWEGEDSLLGNHVIVAKPYNDLRRIKFVDNFIDSHNNITISYSLLTGFTQGNVIRHESGILKLYDTTIDASFGIANSSPEVSRFINNIYKVDEHVYKISQDALDNSYFDYNNYDVDDNTKFIFIAGNCTVPSSFTRLIDDANEEYITDDSGVCIVVPE